MSLCLDRAWPALALVLAAAVPAGAGEPKPQVPPRRFELGTQSKEAKELLAKLQKRIESLNYGPMNQELARKIVALDPSFALGVYYNSAVVPPPENRKLLEKAAELAKSAPEGDRRFIEAMVVARGDSPAQSIAPLQKLAKDYRDERVVHMLLGQVLMEENRVPEARAAYEKAIAIDASTPRAYSFLGNLLILEGEYAKARAAFQDALARVTPGAGPGPIRYNIAFTYLYEGAPDRALESLRTFVGEYQSAGQPWGIPEVFIWNSIARIQLENGQPEEAIKAYKQGYESVPGSNLDESEKKLWVGRLHHGLGRALARMGKFDEAWKQADIVKAMIDAAGEHGKEHVPAWHYLAGYIKLEQGDVKGAIHHLKQSDPQHEPFRGLLLARAYERAGDKAQARKAYEEIVRFTENNIDRALAYPEAKRRLGSL